MVLFGDLLRSCLSEAGMSQMDLARAVGTSSSVVSQTCTGRRPPPLDRIAAWAEALKLAGGPRDDFISAAYLAHAPGEVQERLRRLEEAMGGDKPGSDDHGSWSGGRSRAPRLGTEDGDHQATVRAALAAIADHQRHGDPALRGTHPLIEVVWEARGMLHDLRARFTDHWLPLTAGSAVAARMAAAHAQLVIAESAYRAARPSSQASLLSALRKAGTAMDRARRALEAAPRSPAGASRRRR
jgi:transcriptional regulator with XRE-family HTH domain